jgi:hypothetical protein
MEMKTKIQITLGLILVVGVGFWAYNYYKEEKGIGEVSDKTKKGNKLVFTR